MAKELRGRCASASGAGDVDLISSNAEVKETPFSAGCFLESVCRDSILRKGKWTTEEEDYATKIISLFNRGLLPIGAGTTLRSYLSDKLNCDPMRITKKFAGASCIGKQVYQPSEEMLSSDHSQLEIEELSVLEVSFYRRVGDRTGPGAMCGSNMVEELDYSHSADPLTAMTSGLEMPFKAPPKLSGLCVKWNRDDTLFDAPSFSPVHHEFKKGRKEKGAGMRTVASAPDFSRLNRLQDTQSTSRSSLSKSFHNNTKEGSFKKKRSQSVMNFMDFERYVSDDSAAGDLLLQFAIRVGTTQSEDKAALEGEPGKGTGAGVGTGFKLGLGLGPAGKRVRLSAAGDLSRWQSKEMDDLYTVKSEYNFDRHRHPALYTEGEGEGEGEGEEGAYLVDQSAALVSDNHASSLQSVGCAFEDEEEEEESASPALPVPAALPMFLPLLDTVNQSAAVEVKHSPSPGPASASVLAPASAFASASVPASIPAASTGSPTAPGITHLVLPTLPLPLLVSDTNSSNSSSDVINVTPKDLKKSFEDPRTTPQLTRKLDGIEEMKTLATV